ncbi:glycosyltransferase [Sphingobacterium sp. HJSM2_6]|uniref:glycosyltransferase n=1 Tax=Sphingobacterium sp. HJSM2_6 TaxID=3366264 RepID=UPI003BEC2DD6
MKENKTKISILAVSLGGGGAEKVISLILPNLSTIYDVTLILMYPVFHFNVPENVKIIILNENPHQSRFKTIFEYPKFILNFLRIIKTNKIDVSISFLTRPNILNGIAKFFYGKRLRVILSERNYPSIEYDSKGFRYIIYKILIPIFYNKSDLIFSNSLWINKDLKDNFDIRVPMTVIYNPIVIPDKYKLPTNQIIKPSKIVSVGRLIPTKNHEMILRAFHILNKKQLNLSIFGAGELDNYLLKYSETLNIDKQVTFLGRVKNVTELLCEYDIFVMSSNSEGFPNALLEAMSVGIPVISTNCLSGPLEILNENFEVFIKEGEFIECKYGLLINVNDSLGLSNAISFLINNEYEYIRYSELSRARAKDYSIDDIFKEFIKII